MFRSQSKRFPTLSFKPVSRCSVMCHAIVILVELVLFLFLVHLNENYIFILFLLFYNYGLAYSVDAIGSI